jgi:hypothetical protein
MKDLIPQEVIEKKIFVIRDQRVMVDRDLAELYAVRTKQLNRQVKRNIKRFPREFMFQLTRKEKQELVPNWHQFKKAKHSYFLPYAFTEHGVAIRICDFRESAGRSCSITLPCKRGRNDKG